VTDDDGDDSWATEAEIAAAEEAIRACRAAIVRARLTMAMCAAERSQFVLVWPEQHARKTAQR